MNILGRKLWIFQYVDDVLGVVHTHMITGALGGFMTGILATKEGCAAFASTTPGGAIEGEHFECATDLCWRFSLFSFLSLE